MTEPRWLTFTKRLNAIAQIGLTYATNAYDIERYEQLRDLAIDMADAYSDSPPERIHDLFTSEQAYPTPKIDVRGVLFHEDKILLVEEASEKLWTLPGGWADIGDTPKQAVEREIVEESGYIARAKQVLAIYDRDNQGHPEHPFAIYKIFFLCEIIGGDAKTSHETSGVKWFPIAELPSLSIGRVLPEQIQHFYTMVCEDDTQTYFD